MAWPQALGEPEQGTQVSCGKQGCDIPCFAMSERALLLLGGIAPSFPLTSSVVSLFFLPSSLPPPEAQRELEQSTQRSWAHTISRYYFPLQALINVPENLKATHMGLISTPTAMTKTAANPANLCFKCGHIGLPLQTGTEAPGLNEREPPGPW